MKWYKVSWQSDCGRVAYMVKAESEAEAASFALTPVEVEVEEIDFRDTF